MEHGGRLRQFVSDSVLGCTRLDEGLVAAWRIDGAAEVRRVTVPLVWDGFVDAHHLETLERLIDLHIKLQQIHLLHIKVGLFDILVLVPQAHEI